MSDERILLALRALAESDRDSEASPELEARLLRAFERKRRQRAFLAVAVWASAGAATAAAILIGIVVARHLYIFPEGSRPEQAAASARIEPATQVVQSPIEPAPAARVPRRKVARVRRLPQPREIVTPFFPLIDAPPPFESGELVRVSVAADAMRAVGLPVDEDHLTDRVEADVLLGQEGLPRAIRFVEIVNQ